MLGLKLPTDPRWANIAEKNIEEILIDHAWCEQKAASSAISIMTQFPDFEEVVEKMSALVQEEMEHFRRVYHIILERGYQLENEKMSQAAETMSNKYRQMEEAAKQEYYVMLEDCTHNFMEELHAKQKELVEVDTKLADLTAKLTSAVEAAKRAEELRIKQDFYRLQLSQADIDEIARLREVTPYLRDSEPLNKVIWKVYYEKPYTDLIGRVVGTGVHTGIYKITNIEN